MTIAPLHKSELTSSTAPFRPARIARVAGRFRLALYAACIGSSACAGGEFTEDELELAEHGAALSVLSDDLDVALERDATVDDGPGEANLLPDAPAALAAASPATQLAFSSPTGLVASTGNLYWTSYSIDEFGPDSATFWRASKSNTPGEERALYRESGDDAGFYFFGKPVWALTGDFFGYFAANYQDNGTSSSQIKRVPLAGGAASVLATSPAYVGTRDLATDGSRLFWADAGGIRSMAIAGGVVSTLAASTAAGLLALHGNDVYYAQGTQIRRVPKNGGAVSVVLTASSSISALYVKTNTAEVFWGEVGGAVRSRAIAGGAQTIYQSPVAGRDVSAVGNEGGHTFWIDCVQPGNPSCRVREHRRLLGIPLVTTLASGGVGARNLQWDAGFVYWGSASGLMKHGH